MSAFRISLARSSSSHSRASSNGRTVRGRAARGGAGAVGGLGLGLHERGDALARVAPVDEELDPHAEEAALLAGQAHHLADHGHGGRLAREVEGQAHLRPELELARALEEDAAGPDVDDRALVLVGGAHEARPVAQLHRDATVPAGGDAQELLEPAVPEERVRRGRDHGVGARDGQLGLRLRRVGPVEPDDRGGPRHLVPAEPPDEGDGLRPRQVDHDHLRPGLLDGLDRPLALLDVDAVDVRASENGGAERAGQALRADDEDLEHPAKSSRNRSRSH